MQSLIKAVSAFSARGARGRLGVLVVFSALLALVILGVSHEVSVRMAEEALLEAQQDAIRLQASVAAAPRATPSTWFLADVIAMVILGSGLFLVAPAMAAAQVGEERRSGTLDLLRTAPLSPNQLVAGFLVGAPTPLYLLLSGPLVLHVASALVGAMPASLVLSSLVLLAAGTAFMMLLSVLASLSIGREAPGGAATLGMAGVMGLVGLVTLGLAAQPFSATWAHVHPAGAMSVLYHTMDADYVDTIIVRHNSDSELRHFALNALEPVFASFVYLLASVLLLFAARRALAGDTPSRLSKLEAIGLFGVATISVVAPMRVVISAYDLDVGNLLALATSLVIPYVACVLGATPSLTAYGAGRARGLTPKASPFWAAAAMLAVGAGVTGLLYGQRIFSIFEQRHDVLTGLAFAVLALTFPIYALFSATRIGTPGARLAFWAVVVTHLTLQLPALAIFFETNDGTDGVKHLLANLGVAVGVIFPLVVAWRQRASDQKVAARAV